MITKLSRITIGNIGNLVEGDSPFNMGKGTVSTSRYDHNVLRVKTSEEDRVSTAAFITNMDRNAFLAHVDSVLENMGLYVADADFRPDRWQGFLPRTITGTFYKDMKR